jgi:hypothetical protein
MTRAFPAPPGRTEFDEFLYAPIGEEDNGMLLSVLSALARRNVDPWDEASRLARLPREAATRFLTTLIAALPGGSSARADPEMHAKRLSALLPQPIAEISRQSNPKSPVASTIDHRGLVRYMVYYVVLTALFFGAQWLMEHPRQVMRSGTADSPTTGTALPHTLTSAPAAAPGSRINVPSDKR